ncbi:hypothetical protein [Gallaecimonas mangrovi]|uniref:hypothetical protein n=1 Tax=Gallaecimonas mangrovi TaxID=2291597 RepID=UPI000E200C17|nr:hypothetical protein [Gallaecimonas mangrovi]
MTPPNWVLHRPKYEKAPYLQLLKPQEDGSQQLLWHQHLPGDASEMVLAAFYDDETFVVAEESGRIFRGNLAGELAPIAQLPVMGLGGGAWLDNKHRRFWFAGEMKIAGREDTQLLGWALPDWQPVLKATLPEYIATQTIMVRSDGNVLFYRHRFEGQQGFFCTDTGSGESIFYPLPCLPLPKVRYPLHRIAFCQDRDWALIPAIDALPVQGKGAKTKVGYQLQLVCLKTFSILWRQSVRPFDLKQLDNGKALLAWCRGKDDDQDALEDFIETLTAIRFCQTEDAAWLHWQDGAVQKLRFDITGVTESRVYPLTETPDALAGRANPLVGYGYKNFDYGLVEQGGYLPIFDYRGVAVVELENLQSASSLRFCRCPAPELVTSELSQQQLVRSTGITIDVDYLVLPECRLQGAKQLLGIIQNAEAQYLTFFFRDRDDRRRSEAEFVQMAIADPGVAAALAEAVALFCVRPDAALLCSGDSKAALSDTVLALAEHSIDYLPLIARYLNVIDGEHCAMFHMKHTLPLIKKKYGKGLIKNKLYKAFNKALPRPFNGKE